MVHGVPLARVDYPLEIAVGSSEIVSLTLSPRGDILTATPTAGAASLALAPQHLPTDTEDYSDIGTTVDTVSSAAGPTIWQLIGSPRQTLLEPAIGTAPRSYQDKVTFRWHVRAVSSGANTVSITLHLYYIDLQGNESDGVLEATQSPVPIVAVVPTPGSGPISTFKGPLAAFNFLFGAFAVVRLAWGIFRKVDDATAPVRSVGGLIGMIRTWFARRRQPDQQKKRRDEGAQQHTLSAAKPIIPSETDNETQAGKD